MPFYVIEQSSRSCLCVYCYKAKLLTVALYDLWPTLHQGSTPGLVCTCQCELCKGGGGASTSYRTSHENPFTAWASLATSSTCARRSSCILRMTGPESMHTGRHVSLGTASTTPVSRIFFKCPRNKGRAERQLFPTTSDTFSSSGSHEGPPPGEISWDMFTEVDARGNATTTRRNADNGGDENDEYLPQGGTRPKNRQV